MKQPKGMPSKRWEQLKTRSENLSHNVPIGTHGGYYKRKNQALNFFVSRWKGNNPKPPTWMKGKVKYFPSTARKR